ncbi:MAG: indole-3-glycerol phosphate synthase TrpC [Dehalococcoidia bacterium]|nr:indole-3-glycerol phosphate synthase TrpC [Dehalococcoidia bacterium]
MILDEIVTNKKREIESAKSRVPLAHLKKLAEKQTHPLDFIKALQGDGIKLIAEVKKASPSKGVIRTDFAPLEIARIYAANGASAISVLTDEKYFQGKLEYLQNIKKALAGSNIPLLRKDFIIDSYQVYESRVYGADAILLIVAILSQEQIKELLNLSHQLGMACLVEVHNETELRTVLQTDARAIGINNRDLTTMTVDIQTTARLRPMIPAGRLVVSESGIKTRNHMLMIESLGVDAVLVGETLMESVDIAGKMKELLGQG